MCCFTGPVDDVSKTCIFARFGVNNRQYLAYSMRYSAPQDLAMVLPIPVDRDRPNPVSFVDLSGYEAFFRDLADGFPQPKSLSRGIARSGDVARLEVVQVGNYDASYVPTLGDFDRLDPRYRMDGRAWSRFPQYKDYGFVVFKLRRGGGDVHPMAFTFATQSVGALFFPTSHVHDGTAHAMADFDHDLYCQVPPLRPPLTRWEQSLQDAELFVHTGAAQGLVSGSQPCYRRRVEGRHPNEDLFVAV